MENIKFHLMVVPGTYKLASFWTHIITFTPLEKSIIERTMQYIKDRTECFDDYFAERTSVD